MDYDRLRDQLIEDEGLRLKPYRCTAGKLTIGVGRNLEDRGITREEALMLLENDIKDTTLWLVTTYPWFVKLSPERQEVLVNMVFNLGAARFAKFTKTLDWLRRGDYEKAADEMLASHWAEQVGTRAQRLARTMRG